MVISLNVVTNKKVTMSDVLRDYTSWRVLLAQYVDIPGKTVSFQDAYQRVVGYIRNQDPNREHCGPRDGSGCGTKAIMAKNTNRTVGNANKELLRRLDRARDDTDNAHNAIQCLQI